MTSLNLGCGNVIIEGWGNYDIEPVDERVRKINLEKALPFVNNFADDILLDNVLEHIEHYERLLDECQRVLKKGGQLIVRVPYFRQCGAFRLDHKHFFTMAEVHKLKRKFERQEVQLNFLTSDNMMAILFDWVGIVVSSISMRLYEYYFSALFPASEIQMVFTK